MYDLLHLQSGISPPQRADLPVLRGPYRQARARARARAAAHLLQFAGLALFVTGIACIGSENLTACFAAAAVTAAGAGLTALGGRMGGRD